jgi:hypothetical protein
MELDSEKERCLVFYVHCFSSAKCKTYRLRQVLCSELPMFPNKSVLSITAGPATLTQNKTIHLFFSNKFPSLLLLMENESLFE